MKRVKVITIAFAFMLVLVAASAQPVAAASRSDSLFSYINGRYDGVRGGYSPPIDGVVRVDATYGAILALDELGSLDTRPPPINLTKALDALISRQWILNDLDDEMDQERYGGFSEYLLGPVTMINKSSLLSFINRTQTVSGGFSSLAGNHNPDIVSTYEALSIIEFLSTYDPSLNAWDILANESLTLEWINDCRIDDGFKLNPNSVTIGVTPTAAGIMALGLLPSVGIVPGLQDASNWILARQIIDAYDDDFSGGFEEGFTTGDPNFQSTYYALNLLYYTSSLISVNESMVIDFILNCQVEDGSWGYIPGASLGNLVYAGQACELLNLFGNAATILAGSVDPYLDSGIILDWRYIVIVGIILVALVLAIVSIRRD